MVGYAISKTQSDKLNMLLSDLLVQAEADAVFMSDYGGNIIAHLSQTEDSTIDTIAALAAGSFCATRELAVLIGEPTFHSIFHEGQAASIYMQSITYNFLVLVIFGKKTTAGLVRLYVEKASKELEPILNEIVGQSVGSAGGSGQKFEIDAAAALFKKKPPQK